MALMPGAEPSGPQAPGRAAAPATFGLIHGGAHGAWCWDKLVRALADRGQRAVAMDLPCEDDDAGAAEYAQVVLGALAGSGEPPVLVAHSLGGLTAPLAAAARPVRMMIFIAAFLPVPGRSFNDQRAAEPPMMLPYHGGAAGLRDRFYNTCTAADADWAMARLRRQALTPFTEITPLRQWPAVPSAYLLCTQDHACNPQWARRAVPGRLGVQPGELAGSDHSPFLNRPAELADLLIALAAGDDDGLSAPRGNPG
jgi:pimeloyl-ACP methyl ester carboxylesterase